MSKSQVLLLKWMMEDIRKETLKGVEHLKKEQLFQAPIEGEFPIGAYLMHFAECDLGWLETLSQKEQPEELKKRSYYTVWFDSPEAAPPKEPLEVSEYLETIAETRKRFLEYVSSMDDSQLDDEVFRFGVTSGKKYTKKSIISRMIKHEAHTRGQMFMLMRKAGWNKN